MPEVGVVCQQLVEGDRCEVVDVNARVEHTRAPHDKRPVVVASVVVDMSVDHICTTSLWIRQHRIVAECRRLAAYVHLANSLDALEVVDKSNLRSPSVVVIAKNQMLATF